MAGIRDVAKKAHVGVGTVSRYLNGSGYVSEESRTRIEDAIRALDYQPNELARNLYHNRSGIIGLIVPDLEHPFFSKLSKYIEISLYERNYKTMICNTVGVSNREKEYLGMLERNIMDGIIVASHTLQTEDYLRINRPILAMDKDFKGQIPLVHSDHKKGGKLAAEILISAGCKNVLQFTPSSKVTTPSNQRHIVFERICREKGIRVTTIETNWNSFSHQYYRQYMKEEIDKYRHTGFDGVFTADIPAIACLNVLKQKGYRIPEDVKIVGYDGVDEIYMTDPPLSSVAQNIPELAARCVDTIICIIEGKEYERHQIVDVNYVKGKSV
ncbi:LacI family DNA-binding transcriptional regulator [Faecalicatena contorta]|uniref:LacI family DNA-binding transcriptional regulator n=1 Tax=Faecalicatena contorta TaxID=39482 RepID=UPI001960F13E|nr:LacI family DNA-binding transcriptional regulator [Faecalicatena contorta]MBM6686633.1 LacI family DNA-binding transcriptional regulator [Faecalicatena contorta]MBM6711949.1 LacI family DNA-binding transcriptional regulator [Faecalicatena contorta]